MMQIGPSVAVICSSVLRRAFDRARVYGTVRHPVPLGRSPFIRSAQLFPLARISDGLLSVSCIAHYRGCSSGVGALRPYAFARFTCAIVVL